MLSQLAEQISSILHSLLPVGTLAIALMVGYSAAKINRKNKMVDVAMHCITRYDVISHDRTQVSSREQALSYYRRYFGLKSDQFDYWLSGLIDAENMASWSYATLMGFEQERHLCYEVNGTEECMTFSQGWEASINVHDAPNATFVRVMEEIRTIARKELESKAKYYELITLLERTEEVEQDFIRFADVGFFFLRIRGGNMRAFRNMEERHHKRVNGVSGHTQRGKG